MQKITVRKFKDDLSNEGFAVHLDGKVYRGAYGDKGVTIYAWKNDALEEAKILRRRLIAENLCSPIR